MNTFVAMCQGTEFRVTHCSCGLQFALTADFERRRREDQRRFYCPQGHELSFKTSELDRVRGELAREKARTEAAQQVAESAKAFAKRVELERDSVARAHKRMRERVANGVCPCCRRTFQNLRDHMRTEHPDFVSPAGMRALRHSFGMSQADVAREVGVTGNHVSAYERGESVVPYARDALVAWLERHRIGVAAMPEPEPPAAAPPAATPTATAAAGEAAT